jgi:hypothetical protein
LKVPPESVRNIKKGDTMAVALALEDKGALTPPKR